MSDTRLPRPPLALIVSEHEWSARSLESILAPNGYAVLRCYSGRQALERARAAYPDVVFIEVSLPDMDGVELCRVLRQEPSIPPSTPIVLILSGLPSREHRLAALRAGAWDLIRLPLDADEFLLRMDSYVRAKFDADRAREESLLDFATGLYSIRGMLMRARELASEATRYHRALACIVLSPEVAEPEQRVGEAEETALMSGLAQVLRTVSRGGDAIGRLGHTEFVVLAPDTDPDGASRLATRIAAAVESVVNEGLTDPQLRLRAGFFAVSNFKEAGIDAAELLTRATAALRRAQSQRASDPIRAYRPPQAEPPLN